MKFWYWVLVTFVFVPFSAIISFFSFFFSMSVYGYITPTTGKLETLLFENEVSRAYDISFVIFSIIMAIGVPMLFSFFIRLIRFGSEHTNIVTLIGDILIAPIRLPLMLIADIIVFIGMFTSWEIDPFMEGDDGISAITTYLFMVEGDSGSLFEDGIDFSRIGDWFADFGDRWVDFWGEFDYCYSNAYKLKAVLYQFLILIITVLHSVGMYEFVYTVLPNNPFGETVSWETAIGVLYVPVAFILISLSAGLKGIEFMFETGWQTRKVTRDANGKVHKTPWTPDRCVTLMMLIYMILSPIIVVVQTVCVLVTIFAPRGCCLLPADSGIREEENFSPRKILYILTGICS